MTVLEFETADIPPDLAPDTDPDSAPESNGWFDPAYPHSTSEHPYGYFLKSDGSPDFDRPRKRRPHGTRSGRTSSGMPASDKQARSAAKILATMNSYIGMSLVFLGLPKTSHELVAANEGFEEMAYNALLSDPALCRKILSAGTTSGKAQLTMAYIMLGGALAPVAISEVKDARKRKQEEGEDDGYSS